MRFGDYLGKQIKLENVPKRIVSLVPSQTELLVDLGLKDRIVGITKFCVHPRELRKTKKIVGGTKQVNYDKIKKLKPDLILCNKEENTLEMVTELQKIAPVHISDIKTISDSCDLINDYAELFDCIKEATRLILEIKKTRALFRDRITRTNRSTVLYLIWRDPWMTIGSDTFIHKMLEENHLKNYCGDRLRYPEINLLEVSQNNAPDFIFLSSEPYPFQEKHRKEFLSLFPKSSIILVDGEYFSWYGSRLLKAYAYFEELKRQL